MGDQDFMAILAAVPIAAWLAGHLTQGQWTRIIRDIAVGTAGALMGAHFSQGTGIPIGGLFSAFAISVLEVLFFTLFLLALYFFKTKRI